jgi:hypothetical protein
MEASNARSQIPKSFKVKVGGSQMNFFFLKDGYAAMGLE